MAKKRTRPAVTPATETEIRHIQLQLAADAYDRRKEIAKANGLSMAAYVRQAILQRIRADSGEMGAAGK